MSLIRKLLIRADDSPSVDAFGRWRVSNPVTLFDSKNIFNDPDLGSNVENQDCFLTIKRFLEVGLQPLIMLMKAARH